jgi:polyferredoxin
MDNSNEKDKEPEEKNPRFWGIIYILIGITGLAFSVYALIYSIGMIPLYGTVTAGVLIGLLSIIIIIYGYGVFNRNY